MPEPRISHAILSALDQLAPVPDRAILTGIRITVKLREDGWPRTVIVEPELRFEST